MDNTSYELVLFEYSVSCRLFQKVWTGGLVSFTLSSLSISTLLSLLLLWYWIRYRVLSFVSFFPLLLCTFLCYFVFRSEQENRDLLLLLCYFLSFLLFHPPPRLSLLYHSCLQSILPSSFFSLRFLCQGGGLALFCTYSKAICLLFLANFFSSIKNTLNSQICLMLVTVFCFFG